MTTLDYADSRTLWQTILAETAQAAQSEPMLASFLHQTVLRHSSIDRVLAFHLSSKLASPVMDSRALNEIFFQALDSDTRISKAMQADIVAYYERDPACDAYYLPLLYYKGFHAVQAHRINHWLWQHGRKTLAYFLQNRASEVFGIDIHPAARFGHGIMVDHGTGLVVGETAVLGNDISILHGVTRPQYRSRRARPRDRSRQRAPLRRYGSKLGFMMADKGYLKTNSTAFCLANMPADHFR